MEKTQQQKKLEEFYEKRLSGYQKMMDRREEFLEKNDERVEKFRERNDNTLHVIRAKSDARTEERRKKIEEKYIRNDAGKQARFDKMTARTDTSKAARRERQDRQIAKRREAARKRRAANEARVQKAYEENLVRQANRLKKDREYMAQNRINPRVRYTIIGIIVLAAVFCISQLALPGSFVRTHFGAGAKEAGASESVSAIESIPDEQPVREVAVITKEYDTLDGLTEEQHLWDVLMDYFGGNKTAVLGVMCNLNAESRFKAACLEDYNNEMWGIDDEYYTMRVNKRTVERKDFAESRWDGISTGYFNAYQQWVNRDGGYGYAQVTAYDKKDDLYKFADYWFSPGGPGEDYLFNIADPKMQAQFLISILESDQYSQMNYMIRHAQNVVDACYYWLKMYEIPYDPYADNYYTLSFDRAAAADEIEWLCTHNRNEQE